MSEGHHPQGDFEIWYGFAIKLLFSQEKNINTSIYKKQNTGF